MFRRASAFFLLGFSLLQFRAWAGNSQWVQVRSPNFTVYTDAGEKRGRDVALHFEQMRAVFGALFDKVKVSSSQPMYILAFRNNKEFRSVCPIWKGKAENLAGFFQQGNGVTYIALDLSTEETWQVVFHEYGHFLLNSNSTQMPPWFDEGFAQYFQTVKVEGKNYLVGNMPPGTAEILRQYTWLPVADLFSVTHNSPFYNESNRQTIFYAESWLAFLHYWFFSPMQKQMIAYLQIEGSGVPVKEAIQRAFGMDAKDLDKELMTFYRTGRAQVYRYPMPAGLDNLSMTVTPVDDIDARARVAELKLQMRDHQTEAVEEFQEVLKEKPDQPVALRGLAYAALQKGNRQAAADYFKRAAATQSDDAHIYYFSAVLATQLGAQGDPALLAQMQKDLERAVQLDPTFADAYGWLGLSYAWQQKSAEAIAPAEKAVELSPRNDQWAMNLASMYASEKRYDDAMKLCERLTASDNPAIAAQARSMLNGLTQYKETVAKYGEQHIEVRPQNPEQQSEAMKIVSSGDTPPEGPDTTVLSFFAGTLTNIICSGRHAVLTVTSGAKTLTLTAPDVDQVSFSGKISFSCGLHNAKVKGFYNKDNNNQLVALEFQ